MLMMRTLLMKAPRHSYWMKTLLCTERGQSDLKRPCVFSLLCTRWQETCRKEPYGYQLLHSQGFVNLCCIIAAD
uniref:Uncharacterized protein n=1 Tax=Physcomitrium patens TaxID=3218 RepID=A0A7I4DSA8_PHYPA